MFIVDLLTNVVFISFVLIMVFLIYILMRSPNPPPLPPLPTPTPSSPTHKSSNKTRFYIINNGEVIPCECDCHFQPSSASVSSSSTNQPHMCCYPLHDVQQHLLSEYLTSTLAKTGSVGVAGSTKDAVVLNAPYNAADL